MLYVCFAALGCAAGLTLRWPGLLVIASLVPTAVGVAGAVHAVPLTTTLTEAVIAVLALDLGYTIPLLACLAPSLWDASRT